MNNITSCSYSHKQTDKQTHTLTIWIYFQNFNLVLRNGTSAFICWLQTLCRVTMATQKQFIYHPPLHPTTTTNIPYIIIIKMPHDLIPTLIAYLYPAVMVAIIYSGKYFLLCFHTFFNCRNRSLLLFIFIILCILVCL